MTKNTKRVQQFIEIVKHALLFWRRSPCANSWPTFVTENTAKTYSLNGTANATCHSRPRPYLAAASAAFFGAVRMGTVGKPPSIPEAAAAQAAHIAQVVCQSPAKQTSQPVTQISPPNGIQPKTATSPRLTCSLAAIA